MSIDQFRKMTAATLAIVSLIGFMLLHAIPAIQALRASPIPGLFTGATCIAVSTTLSGLVSGIVAGVFGVQPARGGGGGGSFVRGRVFRFAGAFVPGDAPPDRTQQFVAMGFIVCYFLTALLALIALIVAPTVLPSSTSSLALYAPGVIVAIVHGYLASP